VGKYRSRVLQVMSRICRRGSLFQCINNSLITLIQKKQSPSTVNDYRTISLLNYCLKLLTKLLAQRLQQWILKLVNCNQYGFIRGRMIQDCLPLAFEFIYQCETSRREIIVLKLYFKKAFDMIELAWHYSWHFEAHGFWWKHG
jgi:hypothetical protein